MLRKRLTADSIQASDPWMQEYPGADDPSAAPVDWHGGDSDLLEIDKHYQEYENEMEDTRAWDAATLYHPNEKVLEYLDKRPHNWDDGEKSMSENRQAASRRTASEDDYEPEPFVSPATEEASNCPLHEDGTDPHSAVGQGGLGRTFTPTNTGMHNVANPDDYQSTEGSENVVATDGLFDDQEGEQKIGAELAYGDYEPSEDVVTDYDEDKGEDHTQLEVENKSAARQRQADGGWGFTPSPEVAEQERQRKQNPAQWWTSGLDENDTHKELHIQESAPGSYDVELMMGDRPGDPRAGVHEGVSHSEMMELITPHFGDDLSHLKHPHMGRGQGKPFPMTDPLAGPQASRQAGAPGKLDDYDAGEPGDSVYFPPADNPMPSLTQDPKASRQAALSPETFGKLNDSTSPTVNRAMTGLSPKIYSLFDQTTPDWTDPVESYKALSPEHQAEVTSWIRGSGVPVSGPRPRQAAADAVGQYTPTDASKDAEDIYGLNSEELKVATQVLMAGDSDIAADEALNADEKESDTLAKEAAKRLAIKRETLIQTFGVPRDVVAALPLDLMVKKVGCKRLIAWRKQGYAPDQIVALARDADWKPDVSTHHKMAQAGLVPHLGKYQKLQAALESEVKRLNPDLPPDRVGQPDIGGFEAIHTSLESGGNVYETDSVFAAAPVQPLQEKV